MSDSENDPLSSLLSSFALGPAWARATGDKQERKQAMADRALAELEAWRMAQVSVLGV